MNPSLQPAPIDSISYHPGISSQSKYGVLQAVMRATRYYCSDLHFLPRIGVQNGFQSVLVSTALEFTHTGIVALGAAIYLLSV